MKYFIIIRDNSPPAVLNFLVSANSLELLHILLFTFYFKLYLYETLFYFSRSLTGPCSDLRRTIFFGKPPSSNLLAPTAVNVDLLPYTNHKINLGSDSKSWKNFYFTGDVYKRGHRFLSSDGPGNLFLGNSAGEVNTGSRNTAIGEKALYRNTTGHENTATGYGALHNNTIGFWNHAYGYQALFNNTTGMWNHAYGYQALYNNTEGFGNHAFGSEALFANTTGVFNDAFGGITLRNNTTGFENTAIGHAALVSNTEGFWNVGCGGSALWQNSTGWGNTAVGYAALGNNTANSDNTAIGDNAGGYSLDFSNATLLGAWTGSDSGLANITAVGYGAYTTASNQVVVGNSSVTSIGGYANWSNFSDGRYKKNIKEDVPGLEFITQLRPVTYTLDVDGIESSKKGTVERKRNFTMPGLNGDISIPDIAFKKSEKQQSEELKAKQEKAQVVYTGFIAQEVEQAAKKLNYDFSGVDKPKTEKGFYALRYGDFIVPLVKAVQEQQKQIEEQQKQIEDLKALVQSISRQSVSDKTNFSSSAYLKQNAPNPFNKSTVIKYYIPDNAGNAQIAVTDMRGSLIRTFTAPKGEGQININSSELSAGTYYYTLLIDSKKIDSKQMILMK